MWQHGAELLVGKVISWEGQEEYYCRIRELGGHLVQPPTKSRFNFHVRSHCSLILGHYGILIQA